MSSLFHRLSGLCWLRSVTMVDAQSSLLSLPSFSGTPKKTILSCRLVICCCSTFSSSFFSQLSSPFVLLFISSLSSSFFCSRSVSTLIWTDIEVIVVWRDCMSVEIVSSLIPSVRPSSSINSSVEGPGFDSTYPQSLRKREEGSPSYTGGVPVSTVIVPVIAL